MAKKTTKKTTKKTAKKTPTKKRGSNRPREVFDPDEPRQQLSMSIRRSLLARIDELAAEAQMTRSAFVDALLADVIAQQSEEERFMSNPTVRAAFFNAFTAPGVMAALVESFKSEIDPDDAQQFMEFMEHQADGFNVARGKKGP
jgi:hypothetical protein